MVALRHDDAQRFTCRQCARCCTRGWDVAVTAAEVEAYRREGAEAWFTETAEEPATRDPFEPIGGHPGHFRIRKRADGACGFLSAELRCRIHERLGGGRKPLTCRLFPFRFHPVEGRAIVSASLGCPTVLANEGEPVGTQVRALGRLYAEWERAFPEPRRPVELVSGRPIPAATAATVREVLRAMLDRAGADGTRDLRANVRRMAAFLDDLTRHRVITLEADRLAEYVDLTGRYAAASDRPAPDRAPSALGRLLSRGFLFAVLAAREQVLAAEGSSRMRLRARLSRLLAHAHGLGGGVGDIDLRAARGVSRALEGPEVTALVHHYLRAAVEGLGTGRRPIVDELVLAVALLDAALAFAAMRAGQAGAREIDARTLTDGLLETLDLAQVEAEGAYARVVTTLAGGLDALDRFAASG